ncbi:hypothetical protein GQ53DRAFT_661955 [Thozetella sp. PMI_491]|nr:hypothetical protein GQ53DRAFT_661955 [Thozetella sp. PMI_491]
MLLHSALFGTITSFALLASPVAALAMPSTDSPAHSIKGLQKRSSIDIEDACAREYGDDWVAIKDGDGCYDWNCLHQNGGEKQGVNLNLYCFETVGVRSYATCNGGAWGWSCNTY